MATINENTKYSVVFGPKTDDLGIAISKIADADLLSKMYGKNELSDRLTEEANKIVDKRIQSTI